MIHNLYSDAISIDIDSCDIKCCPNSLHNISLGLTSMFCFATLSIKTNKYT